jgi:hypothetical protein
MGAPTLARVTKCNATGTVSRNITAPLIRCAGAASRCGPTGSLP